MANLLLINLTGILLLSLVIVLAQANECPSSSKIYTCTPRCFKDSDCASIGGKCCPNLCNQSSCVARHMLTNTADKNGSRPDKHGLTSGSVYCGNVKCTAFEKCQMDRITKKEKCVRA